MKKIIVLLLAAAMILGMFGCGEGSVAPSATTPAPAETAAPPDTAPVEETPGISLSADGRFPAETVKIGFVNYDTTAEQVLAIQSYFADLEKSFNFEVIWSESLASAEEEFDFISQCAAAGCKAVIGYYNEGKEESAKLCSSLGMYYWGLSGLPEAYEAVKNDPYYLGCFNSANNRDYEFGHAIAQMLVESGCHRIIVMSGGKDYGVDFFIDRYEGIMAGFQEARDGGYDIEVVYEVPGWPGTEEFAAHQTAALATDADGLAGTLTSLMWIQPMQNAGKFGAIKTACVDTASQTVVDMMGAGMYVGICAEIPDTFGLAIPMILNAVTGFGAQQRNADGSAPLVNAGYWVINNIEAAGFYASIEKEGAGWTWDAEDIKTVLGAYNPAFTLADFNALYSAVSVEDIQARRAN